MLVAIVSAGRSGKGNETYDGRRLGVVDFGLEGSECGYKGYEKVFVRVTKKYRNKRGLLLCGLDCGILLNGRLTLTGRGGGVMCQAIFVVRRARSMVGFEVKL